MAPLALSSHYTEFLNSCFGISGLNDESVSIEPGQVNSGMLYPLCNESAGQTIELGRVLFTVQGGDSDLPTELSSGAEIENLF